jgi:hypothetical protein
MHAKDGSVVSSIKYLDDEKELISMYSDADLLEAIVLMQEMEQKFLKLNVSVLNNAQGERRASLTSLNSMKSDGSTLNRNSKSNLQKLNDYQKSGAETIKSPNTIRNPRKSPAESKTDEEISNYGEEIARFESAILFLKELGSQLVNIPPQELISFVSWMINKRHQLDLYRESGTEHKITWNCMQNKCKSICPSISGLKIFEEPDRSNFLNSIEIVLDFLSKHFDEARIYSISPLLTPFLLLDWENAFALFALIPDIPERIKRILEKAASFVKNVVATHVKNAGSAVSPSVHPNITCDSCGMNPIIGPRFKCTVCNDYDLCYECESNGVHPEEHDLIMFKTAVPKVVAEQAVRNAQKPCRKFKFSKCPW